MTTVTIRAILDREKIEGIAGHLNQINSCVQEGYIFATGKTEEIKATLANLVEKYIDPTKELVMELNEGEREHSKNLLFEFPRECERFVREPTRINLRSLIISINLVVDELAWFARHYKLDSTS